MNIKRVLSVHAVLSLMAGAVLYFLFRPRTLFLFWLSGGGILASRSFPGDTVIRYHLPDAFWSGALCFSLFRLHLPAGWKAVLWSAVAFGCGCTWEALQYFDLVSGTADVLDCIAYGLGSLYALCIYYFLLKRGKKQ